MLKRLLVLVVLVQSAILILAREADIQASVQSVLNPPVNLKVEYAEIPLGIDVRVPRLSWILESNQPDQVQAAYQILISSSGEHLDRDTGDVWDTGRIDSDQSVFISYEGPALHSGRRYWWKVRVWDADGQVTEYSEPAWWEMGLLNPTDWQAKWIQAPKVFDWAAFAGRRTNLEKNASPEPPPPAPLFRTTFELHKPLQQARVYIAGLGYYELHLNGQKVGDRVLDPAFTRYDRRVLYTTYDITDQLRTGLNALGVMLGGGWYDMPTRAVWGFDHAPWRDRPVLLCQVEITYSDGTREMVVTDDRWRVAEGPVRFNSVRQGETYDARMERTGWSQPDYDDAAWIGVVEVPGPQGRLSAQMLPPMKVTQTLTPVGLTEPAPGRFVFDLGQNIAGWAWLRVSGPAGTEVALKYGERLAADGTVDQEAIAQHIREERFQTDVYVLKGSGVEEWEPRFVYHGFRYVEVTGFPRRPTLESLRGRVVHTAFDTTGTFASSNEILNKIQQNTLWSYVGNFHGYPTDCPHREKNGWTGDAHLAAETGLLNFASASAYAKWIDDIADEQRPSGEIAAIIPSSGWGYFWGNGPAWDSAFLLIPWYLYEYRGDPRVLTEHYEGLKRYVDYLGRRAEGDIVSIGLGDWVHPGTETPVEVTSTGYYFKAAEIVAETARLLGQEDEAAHYKSLADRIRRAFIARYYDPAAGTYANGSQTALSCALYQGLADLEGASRTAALLAEDVRKRAYHLDTGILGTKYLLRALSRYGYSDVAYALATQTTYPSWGHWIEQGATTLWEQWDGEASRNHIMFGDISAWAYEVLAGIKPGKPGFKEVVIQPYLPTDLQWVRADHTSMYGLIESAWRKEGEQLVLEITIPVNTSALVYVPTGNPDSIRFETIGAPSDAPVAVTRIGEQDGTVVFRTGSGRYRFTGRL